MLTTLVELYLHDPNWQQLEKRLKSASGLSGLVLVAWQIGLWFARALVHQQLSEQAAVPTQWGTCAQCGHRLRSKGMVSRQLMTLVGRVSFRRRVGRCPQGCRGSQHVPLDEHLGITPYQQTSDEMKRLGCLLAVLLPYELAAWLLAQMSGIQVSNDTLWHWVQVYGAQAWQTVQAQLNQASQGQWPSPEPLSDEVAALPLLISADGVKIPFRPNPGTPGGKVCWREVKVAILARIGHRLTQSAQEITQLYQRRVVAVLGDIHQLQARLRLETHRQTITQAPQVIWVSDGAQGFWGLFERCFAHVATGILDFYHAASHLWTVAQAYHDGNPDRTPQMWFERMRHQLRHGFAHRIIKELDWLSKHTSTATETKPILRQVRDYLTNHLEHIRYRQFKKQGFPLGSGVVESACKWLIQQRFKGAGMRWSEQGFNHLLLLRLAWANHRFDDLFSEHSLVLTQMSPN